MRNGKRLLAAVLICAATAAQDKAKPESASRAADKVLAAFKAEDAKALQALAARDLPDPWLVADELCFRGAHDAAEAFAKAAPRKDVEKLPAYVASRRGKPPNTKARQTLAAVVAAFRARDPQAVLAAIDALDLKADDVVSTGLLRSRGYALRQLGRFEESAQAFLVAAEADERLGRLARVASLLQQAGEAAYLASNPRAALAAWERRLAIEEARANPKLIGRTLSNLGTCHHQLRDYDKAIALYLRSLKISRALGERLVEAQTLNNLGTAYKDSGDLDKAAACFSRALKELEEFGHKKGVAAACGNLGSIYLARGDNPRALAYARRALAINEETGNVRGEAQALSDMARAYSRQGNYSQALAFGRRALVLRRRAGDRNGMAITLSNMGNTLLKVGDHAKALECHEQVLAIQSELRHRGSVAQTLGNLGVVYYYIGDDQKALRLFERAVRMKEQLGDRSGLAADLVNLGTMHAKSKNFERALAYLARAQKLYEALGDRVRASVTLANVGLVHSDRKEYDKALDYLERAYELDEELGNRFAMARNLMNIGVVHIRQHRHPEAQRCLERALAIARELGAADLEVAALCNVARGHVEAGRPADAAKAARAAVAGLPLLVGGLGEEQGARAREQWAQLYADGIEAGLQLRDTATVYFFLESGRAGALLESLGGRNAMGDVTVPPELREQERAAGNALRAARAALAQARRRGRRKDIGKARAKIRDAETAAAEAVSRIQRTAKAAADVSYPTPAKLERLRGTLKENETLVLYGVGELGVLALAVSREGVKATSLGKTEEIRAGWRSLALDDADADPSKAITALRRRLVEPLGLAAGTRLLVSPAGELAYVPFAALAPELEVAYVPSGTTLAVLREAAHRPGTRVLALGDPDYGGKRDVRAMRVHVRGGKLVSLPGTRAEAKAVGDVVLLGKDATETALARALGKHPRWRAVHLACHGLVDPQRPLLSALALTPDARSDGFLTTLEVFRMSIPADLVVLSACETGKGKLYRSEGVVGFTRAFVFAGAPRVIVSLWRVDDAATRALMVKFYELWAEHPTAIALKKAQEFVRGHERWKHPYYWAAWQLWGLPE